ncbi:hypothetical protein LXA43DRAFT_1049956 [Ganoderma leucocontextum]|nr:hypothetical protein LXA43DRAFT_1049956 [Ganoderma leucocontextum]
MPRPPRPPSPIEWDPVPRPCVLLLLQTELSYFRSRRPILCHTELRPFARWARDRTHPYRASRGDTPPRATTPSPRSRQGTPGQSRSRSRQGTPGPSRSRQATPGPSQPKSVRFPSYPPVSDDEGGGKEGDHDITKLGEPDADGLIPKPNGEVGRKKRGYSLQAILRWNESLYKAVKSRVNAEVSNYLDHGHSTCNQPTGAVKNLTKLIAAEYPIVSKFRDGWPIADLIHLRLKYTSGRRGAQFVPQGTEYPKSLPEAMVRYTLHLHWVHFAIFTNTTDKFGARESRGAA